MLASLLRERDEPEGNGAPHLSHSRVNRYLLCPEQYRLYYLEHLRPKVAPASLAFGQIVHQALAELLGERADPVKHFQDAWGMLARVPLSFSQRESWEKLNVAGEALLTEFASRELPKLGRIESIEHSFSLGITGLELPFVGIMDLVADVEGKRTVADWKTAGSAFDEHEAAMSDQLTAYKLAEPQAEQLALCVLVKTKDPQIVWHVTDRSSTQLMDYLSKVGYVAREIAASRFYKRPGKWCAWCDFLPVCLGNRTKAAETLVSVA